MIQTWIKLTGFIPGVFDLDKVVLTASDFTQGEKINHFSSSPQMIIEARRGNGPYGDIAVDDFRIRDGACPAEGDCDFEHLDFCSWSQDTGSNDTFDWIIGSGRTGSHFVTGPSIDHTTNSAGGKTTFYQQCIQGAYKAWIPITKFLLQDRRTVA